MSDEFSMLLQCTSHCLSQSYPYHAVLATGKDEELVRSCFCCRRSGKDSSAISAFRNKPPANLTWESNPRYWSSIHWTTAAIVLTRGIHDFRFQSFLVTFSPLGSPLISNGDSLYLCAMQVRVVIRSMYGQCVWNSISYLFKIKNDTR